MEIENKFAVGGLAFVIILIISVGSLFTIINLEISTQQTYKTLYSKDASNSLELELPDTYVSDIYRTGKSNFFTYNQTAFILIRSYNTSDSMLKLLQVDFNEDFSKINKVSRYQHH